MHTKADARWDQVRELRPFILETLPYKGKLTEDNEQIKLQEAISHADNIDEYEDPIYIMAGKVLGL